MMDATSAAEPRRSILVVEDDEDIRQTIARALEAAGYTVATARNGREALDLLSGTERPCLILLDLLMPVMNGPDFLSELRAHDVMAGIPVVVVSAYERLAASLPVQGVIRKPFELQDLFATAARYCAPAP